jgi:hypothetical protein
LTRLLSKPTGDAVGGLALAAGLTVLAFVTTGGFDQSITVSGANTWSEIVITLVGASACAGTLLLGARQPRWGAVTVGLFALMTAFTVLSITWSAQPDNSWQASSLTLAYLAAFAGGASLARLVPGRWPALLGAVGVTAVVLSGYALLAKVFPGSLAASQTEGRLQAPLEYWNATGVVAAFGLPPCLWAWTRREGGPVLRTLAVPSGAILIAVIVLSYSRSAVLVAVITLGCWLAFLPRRLHSVSMLVLSGAGAAVIAGWALARPAITSDGATLVARTSAGHTYGVVLLVSILLLTGVGAAVVFASGRVTVPETVRRRIGMGLLGLLALVPVLLVVGLAASSRGLTGEISHAWHSLTSVNSGVGDSPSRLGQFGSSRPLYWSEGITVGEHALLKGAGALGYATARTRYTTNPHVAGHAHSYVIQTFADFGLIGLAITAALLVAWCMATARAIEPRTGWTLLDPRRISEREGLVTLALVVLAFGLQSAIDWTWFFPGVTVPTLLCAGWLAGRGPLARPVGRAARRAPILNRPGVGAAVTVLIATALLGAWLIWQPLRSANAANAAETAGGLPAAFASARSAADYDPLSLQPLLLLASLYESEHDLRAARSELVKGVNTQPDNYESWLALGTFDLNNEHDPERSLPSLRRAVALNPTVPTTTQALAVARLALVAKQR